MLTVAQEAEGGKGERGKGEVGGIIISYALRLLQK